MSRSSRGLPNTFYLSLITVDFESDIPLYRQIYTQLRTAIVDGRLAANTKLPSTRDLSSIWNVSRNTLRNAFDQLIAEGYLEAKVGRGTFVSAQSSTFVRNPQTAKPKTTERIRPISVIGRHLEPIAREYNSAIQSQPAGAAFAVGVPDRELFPHKLWGRILNRCQQRRARRTDYGLRVNGIWKLREAIASYLVSARGLQCTPEQIDIVPGSISGIMITSLALLNSGDKVWIENPAYINVSGLIRYRGIELVPLSVDRDGMQVEHGLQQAPDARLAYVTPSHQYPLGTTMSRARRQQLLDWAADQHSWIIEDDYDSAFRYDGPPLASLQGMDTDQRVIYCGTFSKIMLPELRLGYVVLPADLVDVYTGVKMPLSQLCPVLVQEAAAEFMLEGHFVRHIRRMQKHYHARRDALIAAVDRHLAGAMHLGPADCGIHTVGYLADGLDEQHVLQQAYKVGMAVAPLSPQYLKQPVRHGIVIGFANVKPEEIDQYIRKLAHRL